MLHEVQEPREDPSVHSAWEPRSPFPSRDADYVAMLERRSRAAAEHFGTFIGPAFVSTRDLLHSCRTPGGSRSWRRLPSLASVVERVLDDRDAGRDLAAAGLASSARCTTVAGPPEVLGEALVDARPRRRRARYGGVLGSCSRLLTRKRHLLGGEVASSEDLSGEPEA